MSFGKVLKRVRERAELTQAALAAKSGLSLRTLQAWEQGRGSPVSPDFFRLVEALGAEHSEFADLEPPAKPKKKGKR